MLLQIQNVSVAFQNQKAVNQLSFDIQKGKTTAIVGESGSGKSVTALAILGLLPREAQIVGTIMFEKKDLLSVSEKHLRRIRGSKIGMIFQEPMTSLNPVFTIGEQIAEVIKLQKNQSRRGIQAKTREALQEVGIQSNRIHGYPHEFSGGMRQRVMIAMALANEPQLLIADEPTTALDATTAKQIMKLLIAMKIRRKMSMLFISHDLGLVSNIADALCVMHLGCLVESGMVEQVIGNPTCEYTRTLLSSRITLPSV